MRARPAHRAGMAVVRVEAELADDTRVVIRVSTVDDVTGAERLDDGRSFADPDAAGAFVRDWLARWLRR